MTLEQVINFLNENYEVITEEEYHIEQENLLEICIMHAIDDRLFHCDSVCDYNNNIYIISIIYGDEINSCWKYINETKTLSQIDIKMLELPEV